MAHHLSNHFQTSRLAIKNNRTDKSEFVEDQAVTFQEKNATEFDRDKRDLLLLALSLSLWYLIIDRWDRWMHSQFLCTLTNQIFLSVCQCNGNKLRLVTKRHFYITMMKSVHIIFKVATVCQLYEWSAHDAAT